MIYTVKIDGVGVTYEAESPEEAIDQAEMDLDAPSWNERTVWCDIVCEDAKRTIQLDPDTPPCDGSASHTWDDIHVRGHGGGVVSTQQCRTCGAMRRIDTWAQRHDNGAGPFTTVTYPEMDE